MVTRKRRLLLAVVAVSATGVALSACSDTHPTCNGFTASTWGCGNGGPPIDAGVDDGSRDGGSATDAHVANDSPSDGSIE
ncbi:MAG TPA: hypothetical protein VF765_38055 [Polyangiaceae bacterium]